MSAAINIATYTARSLRVTFRESPLMMGLGQRMGQRMGQRRMSHCAEFVLPTWLLPEAYLVGSSHSPGKTVTSAIALISIIY